MKIRQPYSFGAAVDSNVDQPLDDMPLDRFCKRVLRSSVSLRQCALEMAWGSRYVEMRACNSEIPNADLGDIIVGN